jgi:RimJ/RimL family protein N-acetyltransferase
MEHKVDAAHYSVSEVLRDGSSIDIRALKPDDHDELLSAVERMSDESIQRRFFAPKRYFTEREIEFYLNVDFVNHIALVAVLNVEGRARIIGGARSIVIQPGVAEVAFSIDDAHQGRGVGKLLMKHLVGLARSSGLRELVADVLPGNMPMLSVFEKCGLKLARKNEAGVVHVTLHLP